jgi:protoheme IX farnesyltransferase
MWLKRWTPQNIVIGGAAGALPADDRLGRRHRFGQFPSRASCSSSSPSCGPRRTSGRWRCSSHSDYERAGVPMMPNVAGEASTRRQIFGYSLLTRPRRRRAALAARLRQLSATVVFAAALGARLRVVRLSACCACRTATARWCRPRSSSPFACVYLFAIFSGLMADSMIASFGWGA